MRKRRRKRNAKLKGCLCVEKCHQHNERKVINKSLLIPMGWKTVVLGVSGDKRLDEWVTADRISSIDSESNGPDGTTPG